MQIRGATWWFVLVVLGMWLASSNQIASAQTKSFSYRLIKVNIELLPDGTLNVEEQLTLRYNGGPYTSAVCEIALERLDRIDDIRVSEQGQAYREQSNDSTTPQTFRVERDDRRILVRWYYPSGSDSERSFTLNYRVLGALRISREEDELWWVAIFPKRSALVEQSIITLNLPEGATITQAIVSLPAETGTITVAQNRISVTRDQPLAAGDPLDLRVRLPGDLISAPAPTWQGTTNPVDPDDSSNTPARQVDPLTDAFATAVVICGFVFILASPLLLIGGIVWFVRRTRRTTPPGTRRVRFSSFQIFVRILVALFLIIAGTIAGGAMGLFGGLIATAINLWPLLKEWQNGPYPIDQSLPEAIQRAGITSSDDSSWPTTSTWGSSSSDWGSSIDSSSSSSSSDSGDSGGSGDTS
jgi:hypothetical protein